MPARHSVRLRPLHDLREISPDEWVAETHDPQFLLEGPFPRGLWELRVRGAAPGASGHAVIQLYCAERGDFSEAASVRTRGLEPAESERRLRFWLPFSAGSLRLDPSSEPGRLAITSVQLVRRNVAAVFALEWLRLARRDVRRAISLPLEILRTWRTEPQSARRMIVELVKGSEDDHYPEWLEQRWLARRDEYPFTVEPGLFSLITTVYDTAPEYIDALRQSVRSQTFSGFEWIVLDNGSRDEGTRAAVGGLAADLGVRVFRVEANLGIIGGMRYVLERATGRYVLPVDSDDVLFPDALAAVASLAQRHGYPPLLYTDEDKLRGGNHTDPFLKPDWDPVLLRNCCYIAHLTALDRAEALRLGSYTDPGAEGCHDWDSFLRFVRAGLGAVHVPDILYSWRMHAASTAADVSAKDYIVGSQRHVLANHVAKSGLAERLEVIRSPHFPASPDWWIRRRRVDAPPASVLVDVIDDDPRSTLAILNHTGGYPLNRVWLVPRAAGGNMVAMAASVRAENPDLEIRVSVGGLARALAEAVQDETHLLAVVDASVEPATDEWLWEMTGLKEAFADAAVVGGRILDRSGRVLSGPQVFGYGRGPVGSPDRGRAATDAGYFGSALKQQSTSAVDGRLCG